MALQVSADGQTVFFNKVFGPGHQVTNRVKGLIGVGVTFEVAFLSIRAFLNEKPLESVKVTYSTTALIKGTAPDPVVAQNKHLISEWVAKLWKAQGAPLAKPAPIPLPTLKATPTAVVVKGWHGGFKPNIIPVVKAIRTVTGDGLAEAKVKAEAILAGTSISLGVFPSLEIAKAHGLLLTAVGVDVDLQAGEVYDKGIVGPLTVEAPKPVPEVVALKDAKALGQKVHGTSAGSVYHTIAIGDAVRVAARIIPGGLISIRAEWQGHPTVDLKRLAESGVSVKVEYASIHVDPQDVPLSRVIGAFLIGTNIKWNAAVMNGAELVVGA